MLKAVQGTELSRVEGRLLDREDGLSKKRKPPRACASASASAAAAVPRDGGSGEGGEGDDDEMEHGETSPDWWESRCSCRLSASSSASWS